MRLSDQRTRLATIQRIAIGATLLTPLFLMHGRGIAEAMIGMVDGCFLIRCAVLGDWRWLRLTWVKIALAWFGWVIFCSVLMQPSSLGQAVLQLRFLLFTAALACFVLREAAIRRWLGRIIAACVVWIAGNSLLQFATGHNLFGDGRGAAGELTGPFDKARAGPALARILPPAIVPPVARLVARGRPMSTIGAYALLLAGLCMMVLVNQRMPLLLTAFALAICAVLLRRVRPLVLAAIVAGGALVAASVVVSPATYQRYIVQFSHQLEGFGSSHYGLIFARAAEIGRQHPWTGLGFDGFRDNCAEPRYFRPSFDGAEPMGGGAEICTTHPHNFYMQALDSGGMPGLLLFCAMALAWLAPLAAGLWRDPEPLRAGLFASIVIQLWPIASTSAFTSMPIGGWFFLLLGWALAEAKQSGGTEARAPVPQDGWRGR